VVIFADVTSSLTVEQNKKVADLTKKIIVHLPPFTAYRVYTIQADPEEEPIDSDTIRASKGPRDEIKRIEDLKRTADDDGEKIKHRYCEVNFTRRESPCRDVSPRPQPDHRSCILEMVESVSQSYLRDDQRRPADLIFISDMVEDCDYTPLEGQSIRLIKEDLSADVANISKFRTLQAIGPGVRITIVRPHVTNGPLESPVRKRTLEQYWKAAFSRFGIDTASWWRFAATLPERFVPDAKAN
jgi:hypothetical protein